MAGSTVVSYDDEKPEVVGAPSQIPVPTGYRILVAPKPVEEKTKSGLYLSETRVQEETDASVVFCVIALGDTAYQDEKKFPSGPWCKKGDWVILPAYAGSKIFIHGMEFRIVNDDTVHAVVEDPREVARA
jgi:co-chaperonin GroES (HSP10)